MKKFVLCMMLAGFMMSVAAQEKLSFESKKIHVSEMMPDLVYSDAGMLPMSSRGALVEVDGWRSVGTSDSYDRQTQGNVYPMTKIHDDGFIAATWTNRDNPEFPGAGAGTRNTGVAYTFSTNGGATWSEPNMRVGGIPVYWSSYAQWGVNGEAILARSADTYEYQGVEILNGLVLMTRENKGVGEWKLTPVPYPAGTPLNNGWIMAWSRMVTNGPNHQYIHIMTHTSGQVYEGYSAPVFYYRTSDGGVTWDKPGILMPEAAGISWHEGTDGRPEYTDNISFAQHGNVIAASFIRLGSHSYMLKSVDNGNTWSATKFFDTPVRYDVSPSQYADTCFIPCHGNIAFDNNGKVHIAFAVQKATNIENDGSISLFTGSTSSFLSYWNEDMAPLNGDDYEMNNINNLMYETFIDIDNLQNGKIYVKSTTPQFPIIGFFTPTLDEHIFTIDDEIIKQWGSSSYGIAGGFSFPQMAFDTDNTLHLAYLGWLDNGKDGNGVNDHWYRHPYRTTRNTNGTWTPTECLVNPTYPADKEFAYLTCAGFYNDKMYMMVQVDQYAGTNEGYTQTGSDHPATTNHYYVHPPLTVPPSPNICMISVDENNHNEIVWKKQEEVITYKVYREGDVSGQYDLIATIDENEPNVLVDMESNAQIRSYRYKVSATNIYGESPLSADHKTMHLTISAGMNNSWNLIWTAYEGTEYSTYNIYRATGATPGEFTLIGTMPAGNTSYSDFGAPATDYVYYMVEIMLNTPCEIGKALASIKSNVATNNSGVGIVETGRAPSLQIYPNPTNYELKITNYEGGEVQIYDLMGRTVNNCQLSIVNCQLKINVSNLPSGMYFLKIGEKTARFVKE